MGAKLSSEEFSTLVAERVKPAADPHEARPRSRSHDSTPINPARLTAHDGPPPAWFDPDTAQFPEAPRQRFGESRSKKTAPSARLDLATEDAAPAEPTPAEVVVVESPVVQTPVVETAPEPVPAPVAAAIVSPTAAPARVGPRRVICDERPGERFTLEQAAALSRISAASIRVACSPTGQRRGASCGGFHFRWENAAPVERLDRPRGRPRKDAPVLPPLRPTKRVVEPVEPEPSPAATELAAPRLTHLVKVLMKRQGAGVTADRVELALAWGARVRRDLEIMEQILNGEDPPEAMTISGSVFPAAATDREEVERLNGRTRFRPQGRPSADVEHDGHD